MISYDLCLLPALFCHETEHVRDFESYMQVLDQCVARKFASGVESIAIQVLQ